MAEGELRDFGPKLLADQRPGVMTQLAGAPSMLGLPGGMVGGLLVGEPGLPLGVSLADVLAQGRRGGGSVFRRRPTEAIGRMPLLRHPRALEADLPLPLGLDLEPKRRTCLLRSVNLKHFVNGPWLNVRQRVAGVVQSWSDRPCQNDASGSVP